MIGVFGHNFSLTESAAGGINEHRFGGTFNEAAGEFSYLLKANAYDIQSYSARADEIIAECMMSGASYKTDVLVENVFQDIVKKAKELWAKLKEWVKGLITKLKAFVYQLTGQTNKWASTMKTRVSAANPNDFSYVMHDWNLETLSILCNIGSIKGLNDVTEEMLDDLKTILKSKAVVNMTVNSPTEDDYKAFETFIHEDSADQVLHKIYDAVGDVIGVKFNNYDLKTIRADINKKITGGEKITMKISKADATGMFSFVENCKEGLNNVERAYKDVLAELDKESKILADIDNAVQGLTPEDAGFAKGDGEGANKLTNFKAMFTKAMNCVIRVCKGVRDIMNECGNSCTKFVKMAAFEAMGCLNAYANAGEKQNKNSPPQRNV